MHSASASTGKASSGAGAGNSIVQRLRRALPTDVVDEAGACHLEQPGARLLDLAERLPMTHGLEKDFLQHVFGAMRITELMLQESEQLGLVR